MAEEICPECGSRLQNAPGYVGQLPDGSPMGALMHCTNDGCDRFWGRDPEEASRVLEVFDAAYDEG